MDFTILYLWREEGEREKEEERGGGGKERGMEGGREEDQYVSSGVDELLTISLMYFSASCSLLRPIRLLTSARPTVMNVYRNKHHSDTVVNIILCDTTHMCQSLYSVFIKLGYHSLNKSSITILERERE